MEQDFGLDLQEVSRVVDSADVIIVRFRIAEPRLLIDARHTNVDGPLIKLVGRAQSVEDRFRGLKELRPRFPLPDKIMSFEWPKHIALLKSAGIWDRIEARMEEAGGPAGREQANLVYAQLLAAERKEEIAAIRGNEGYKTLWERSG